MNLLDLLMFAAFPMMIEAPAGGGAADANADTVETTTTDTPNADTVETATTDGKPDDKKPEGKPVPVEQQMLEGMKAVLKPVDPEEKKKKEEEAKVAAALADESKLTASELEQKRATEATAKKKADDEAAAKLKAKKPEDFELNADEKKNWKQETQRRFNELREAYKARHLDVERLTAENQKAIGARDVIMGLLEEHHVEPEDFTILLNYNKMVKTGDLAGALKIINDARTEILKAMNKEEPGVDLLDDFPDLKAKVAEQEMDRGAALEVAGSRRREAANARANTERANREQRDGAVEQSRKDGLTAIGKWTSDLAKGDINFKAKEQKMLAPGSDGLSQLDRVIREYPSHLWVRTLQALYDAIEIVKPTPLPNKDDQPLRPGGLKPGAKVHTELTADALRDGLKSAGHAYN